MRLIGKLSTEKEAFRLKAYLKSQGINTVYEDNLDRDSGETLYYIWAVNEEDIDKAQEHFAQFQENPDASQFLDVPPPPSEEENEEEIKPEPKKMIRSYPKAFITRWIIIVCALLYLYNNVQHAREAKKNVDPEITFLTPLMTTMIFDYPLTFEKLNTFIKTLPKEAVKDANALTPAQQKELNKIEQIPYWKGIYQYLETYPKGSVAAPMFEKIQQGEVWRLFTPCLMHAGILHILFNMLWLWFLGRPAEERMGKMRYILLMLIIGVVANIAQYLMSGPFFLGYSGVVAGLAGYIWVRHKVAPWEGYPIGRSTFVFLFVFVMLMVVLQVVLFFLKRFGITEYPLIIANTAHIVGGLTGMVLARVPFFAGGRS